MRFRDRHDGAQQAHWAFSPPEDDSALASPGRAQRALAALGGIACALVLYGWAIPPAKPASAGGAHYRVSDLVPDALRALTGFTAPYGGQQEYTAPGAGIRN